MAGQEGKGQGRNIECGSNCLGYSLIILKMYSNS